MNEGLKLLHRKPNTGDLFLAGVFCCSSLMIPGILDLALTPRFVSLATLLFSIVFLFFRSGQALHLKLNLALAAYLAYVLFSAMSTFWAYNKAEALFESGRSLLCFLIFLTAFYYFRKREKAFPPGLLRLSILVSLTTISFGAYQLVSLPDFGKETLYAVTGLNGHKNLFTSFLFLCLPFTLVASRKLSGAWRILSIVSITMAILFIALLRTKAVWLGLFASLVVCAGLWLCAKRKNRWRFRVNPLPALAILILLANFFFIWLLPRLVASGISIAQNTAASGKKQVNPAWLDEERLVVWDKTYKVAQDNLLAGCGAGNWQVVFPKYGLSGLWRVEDLNVTFQRPHNDFLWILSENGLIGLNLFLLFVFSVFVYACKTLFNNERTKEERAGIILCMGFITGFLVISFFDFPKERIEHIIWINLLFACLVSQTKNPLPALPGFTVSRKMYSLVLILLFFTTLVGSLRIKGEYFTRILFDRRNAMDQSGVIKNGKAAWSFAYSLDPTSIPIHWYIGNANASMQNYSDALRDFNEAYSYNPFNRNVLNDLASACVFNKEYEKAKKLYEQSAAISPRFDEPKLNLAALYLTEQNYRQASFWLNSLLHDSQRRSNYQKILDLRLQETSKNKAK